MRRSTLALIAAGAACLGTGLLYRHIRTVQEDIMATIDDVNAAEDRRDAAQGAALQRVADDVTDLRSTVDQLTAQINNGTGDAIATARALDAVVARIEASTAQLQGVDPVPDSPTAGDTTGETPVDETGTTGGDVTPAPGTGDEVIDNPDPGGDDFIADPVAGDETQRDA